MTVFTVNPFDDGYFIDGKPVDKFQQFCMRSWERLGWEIKVFDYNSPEVIEAKQKYKLWIDSALKKGRVTIASDAIRLYILSLYDDLLYFDTDVYIADSIYLKDLEYETAFKIRGHNFCAVYNGRKKNIAKEILDRYYMTDKTYRDKIIIEASTFCSSLPSIQNKSTWIHCPRIGDKKNWYNFYVENVEEAQKYMKEKSKKICFYSYGRNPFVGINNKSKNDYQIKYLRHIPIEDLEQFHSFMDN